MAKFIGCLDSGVVELDVDEAFAPDVLDECTKIICADGGNEITLPEANVGQEICVSADDDGVTVGGPGLDPVMPVPKGKVCCFTFSCDNLWHSSCELPCECVVQTAFARVAGLFTVTPEEGFKTAVTVTVNVTRGDRLEMDSSIAFYTTPPELAVASVSRYQIFVVSGPTYAGQTVEVGSQSTGPDTPGGVNGAGALVTQLPMAGGFPVSAGTYVLALQVATDADLLTIDPPNSPTNATLRVKEVVSV